MNVYYAELNDVNKLRKIIKKIKPKTIFHLSAHGSILIKQSKQN